MSGVSKGRRYAAKAKSKANIYLDEDPEDWERGGIHSPYDPWDDIDEGYAAAIEKNPTAEGVAAAAEKYRKEIVRVENYMSKWIRKEAMLHLSKVLHQKSLKELGLSVDECESKNFVYYASFMEVKAVARVNEIRNQRLEDSYGKYHGEFPEGPSEIEMTVSNAKGEWSSVIQRGAKGNKSPLLIKPGYEDSEAMRRSVHRAIDGTNASASYSEMGDAVKLSYDSGFGASYLLTRRFDIHSGQAEFSEVLIVPSKRETERIDLGTPAINEGWL
jgi:hypothetical protein